MLRVMKGRRPTDTSTYLMPIKSFLTRTSPPRGTGTGKSVLYYKTSGPPTFFSWTPLIVLGIEIGAIVVWNRSCDNRGEGRKGKVKSGIIKIRIMYLAYMCIQQSILSYET